MLRDRQNRVHLPLQQNTTKQVDNEEKSDDAAVVSALVNKRTRKN